MAGGNLDEADIGNQPADVRFVITELLGASQSAGTAVSGLVDPSRIAVVGHSDGAETALLVGYGASDRDPRVDAVVADAANPLDVQPPTAKIRGSAPRPVGELVKHQHHGCMRVGLAAVDELVRAIASEAEGFAHSHHFHLAAARRDRRR